MANNKAMTVILLVCTILGSSGPAIVKSLTDAGLPLWAHILSAVVAVAAAIRLALQNSLSARTVVSVSAPVAASVLLIAGMSLSETACTASQAKALQTAANVVVTVAGDVCQLQSQDDPTAPTWAQVLCKVEGQAGPVLVSVPWSSWLVAQGQTLAASKKAKGPHARIYGPRGEVTVTSAEGY
jgi:hypothetical protein